MANSTDTHSNELADIRKLLETKNEETVSLNSQVARLTADVEELRRDKRDLRDYGEFLKKEAARLGDELSAERVAKEEWKAKAADVKQALEAKEVTASKPNGTLPPEDHITPAQIIPTLAQKVLTTAEPLLSSNPPSPQGPQSVTSSSKTLGKRKASSQSLAPKKVKREPSLLDLPRALTAASGKNGQPLPANSKTKDEKLIIPQDLLEKYLHDAPRLPLIPKPTTLHVRRNFLRESYGGSDQQLLQILPDTKSSSSSTKRGWPGGRRLIFPMVAMNPLMPMQPGEPGLLFASRHEVLENPPWGVFRRALDGKSATWLYLGDYESRLVGQITAAQFTAQTNAFKQSWSKLLTEQKLYECYTSMRARIALRKSGAFPTDNEYTNLQMVEHEMLQITKSRGMEVSRDDIIEAFSRGDEAIDIICMKCVAYDMTFALDLNARYTTWLEKKKKESKKGPAKSSSGNSLTLGSSVSASTSTSTKVKAKVNRSESTTTATKPMRIGPPRRTSQRLRSTWDSETGTWAPRPSASGDSRQPYLIEDSDSSYLSYVSSGEEADHIGCM